MAVSSSVKYKVVKLRSRSRSGEGQVRVSRVRGSQNYQIHSEAEIKWDYRGDIRYINGSKIVY